MGWGQWGTIQSLEDVQCACELRESGFGHGSTFSLSAATRETPSPTIFLCLIFTRLGLTKNCNILEFLRIGYRSYRIGFNPVRCGQGPTGRGFWLWDGTGRVLAKKVGYRDGSGRVVRKFWRQKAHIWEINVRQIIINSRTPKIQTALAWVLDELERNQEKENHLNTISKMMGTLVYVQLFMFSYRKAVIRPQNMPKTADWG